VKRVEAVDVRMRVDCDEDERTVYIDVDLDGHTKSLTRNAAHTLVAALRRQLDNAERFDVEETRRAGTAED
jgi:hypothetical protein